MVTDPTIDSLELLKDASRWVVKKNVPIFIPHVRRGAKGEELYRITENDLRDIAAVCNSRASQGVLGKLQIGHTIKDKPETAQPPLAGLFQNYRPGKFGPDSKPCLLVDFYYDKNGFSEAKKYPFRSAEFYPNTKEITAVALLQRDPELDMGMLLFERKGPCYFYSSKELPMDKAYAEEVKPDEAFDEKEAAKFMMYMSKCFPKFAEQYGAQKPNPAEYQRNGNGHANGTVKPAGEASPLLKENAELYERTGKLEAELAVLRAENKAVQYERKLLAIDPQGQTLDVQAELADLRTMTDAQVESHFKRLERAAQYARSPVGQGFIQTEDGLQAAVAQTRASAPVTQYEKNAAIELCTELHEQGKPMTFAEAVAEIRKKK